MRITHVYESIDESNTRPPSREENIALLERKKRSLLHELKILSMQMNQFITSGVVSQMGEAKNHPNAPVMPDSETRCILTEDPQLQQRVLKVFGRFTTAREILASSVMPELDALEKEGENPVS
jgi:hypothetical protein